MRDRSIEVDFKPALEARWSSLGTGRDPAWVRDPEIPISASTPEAGSFFQPFHDI